MRGTHYYFYPREPSPKLCAGEECMRTCEGLRVAGRAVHPLVRNLPHHRPRFHHSTGTRPGTPAPGGLFIFSWSQEVAGPSGPPPLSSRHRAPPARNGHHSATGPPSSYAFVTTWGQAAGCTGAIRRFVDRLQTGWTLPWTGRHVNWGCLRLLSCIQPRTNAYTTRAWYVTHSVRGAGDPSHVLHKHLTACS